MSTRTRIDVELSLQITAPGPVALSIATAGAIGEGEAERLELVGSAADPRPRVVDFPHGTRVHWLDLAEGELVIQYHAEREGRPAYSTEAAPVSDEDRILYTRPSRYCPSDRFGAIAYAEFGPLPGVRAKVDAIVRYVGERVNYVSGSSRFTDDATDTLLSGEGVCRDFAHLCVSLCRSMDIPARFVAVYAPGLSPMDFHAVFEAAIDGRWWLFDASRLAPRQSMIRIATGRDATDTAFLSTLGCELELRGTSVTAVAEPGLPEDDGSTLVALA
ncbi:transglutaminase-like domain-containing protein [Amycolatopsis nigrescens]|uniref:transglutaminase-like domain-containing protein n=1 Tax=Amycolatopsis nigrescens TaxID=381445 RepID=UPI0003825F3A|nr:transglutaminase family protein [Amycolatopsis nigrescens]